MTATARYVLLRVDDLAPGEMRAASAPGYPPLLVYNVDGVFYVTDDTCTHGIGTLSDGFLDGHVIECPFHGGAFDIRNGAPAAAPCTLALTCYKAEIVDGALLLAAREG